MRKNDLTNGKNEYNNEKSLINLKVNVARLCTDIICGVFSANSEPDLAEFGVLLFDTGAADHMTGDFLLLIDPTPLSGNILITGFDSGFTSRPTYIGNVRILVKNGSGKLSSILLKDVLYVPGLYPNLFSEDKLTQVGAEILITKDSAKIYYPNSKFPIMTTMRHNLAKWAPFLTETSSKESNEDFSLKKFENLKFDDLLKSFGDTRINVGQSENIIKSATLFHRRFDHLSAPYLRKLPDIVTGVPNALCSIPLDSF